MYTVQTPSICDTSIAFYYLQKHIATHVLYCQKDTYHYKVKPTIIHLSLSLSLSRSTHLTWPELTNKLEKHI